MSGNAESPTSTNICCSSSLLSLKGTAAFVSGLLIMLVAVKQCVAIVKPVACDQEVSLKGAVVYACWAIAIFLALNAALIGVWMRKGRTQKPELQWDQLRIGPVLLATLFAASSAMRTYSGGKLFVTEDHELTWLADVAVWVFSFVSLVMSFLLYAPDITKPKAMQLNYRDPYLYLNIYAILFSVIQYRFFVKRFSDHNHIDGGWSLTFQVFFAAVDFLGLYLITQTTFKSGWWNEAKKNLQPSGCQKVFFAFKMLSTWLAYIASTSDLIFDLIGDGGCDRGVRVAVCFGAAFLAIVPTMQFMSYVLKRLSDNAHGNYALM